MEKKQLKACVLQLILDDIRINRMIFFGSNPAVKPSDYRPSPLTAITNLLNRKLNTELEQQYEKLLCELVVDDDPEKLNRVDMRLAQKIYRSIVNT